MLRNEILCREGSVRNPVDMTATDAQVDRPAAVEQNGAAAPVVAAAGLCLSIDATPILQDISLEIAAGESVALLGANGAGKSTLLRVLAGLMTSSSGRLDLFGTAVGHQRTAARARIGIVAHQPMLYRDLSARENIEFFARLYGVSEPGRRAMEVLAQVGMAQRADQAVKALSRGMTHRVAIARALVHRPELLLADEPFDGLDAPSIGALERLLGQLRDEGRTLIVANHDIAQSLALADRVLVLRRGRIVIDAPTCKVTAQTVLREFAAT